MEAELTAQFDSWGYDGAAVVADIAAHPFVDRRPPVALEYLQQFRLHTDSWCARCLGVPNEDCNG